MNFANRHIGPPEHEQEAMLAAIGHGSLDELTKAALPAQIATDRPLSLPDPLSETQALAELRRLAGRNQVLTSMIGLGYYGTVTPPVIRRNVLENPAWYTAYTPYQPEISQGRLEALLNFSIIVRIATRPAAARNPACRMAPPRRLRSTRARSMSRREPAMSDPTGAHRLFDKDAITILAGAARVAALSPVATTALNSRAPSM